MRLGSDWKTFPEALIWFRPQRFLRSSAKCRSNKHLVRPNLVQPVRLSDQYQQFEFKIGYTDRDANETYLGLSEADFNDDPNRRYAASRFDNIATYQTRLYLRHFIEMTDSVDLTTTAYYNRFHRNWYKLNDIRNIDTDGDGDDTTSICRPATTDIGGAKTTIGAGVDFAAAIETVEEEEKGDRSEERRVGKEGRTRWSPDH